jgi:hypothetical protein
MIADKVYGDAHQPGVKGSIAAERGAIAVGLEEAILRQGFRDVGVMDGGKNKSENPRPVPLNDPPRNPGFRLSGCS